MAVFWKTTLTTFWNDTDGNASMEFVVLSLVIFYFVFSLVEAGVLMTRTVMLERGVNIAVRDLRLGITANPDHDTIKAEICKAAYLLKNCESSLLLELTPLDISGNFPTGQANCVDRTEEVTPVINFDPGGRSEIMFVRACLVVDPLFPGMGLGAKLPKDKSGGYAIVVQSAFVNEPA